VQVREISNGIDLFLRDRFRKAYALLPGLLAPPRLPFLPALPAPPPPPLFVPGLGLVRVGSRLCVPTPFPAHSPLWQLCGLCEQGV